MRKKLKKSLAAVLSLVLLLSTFSVGVSALTVGTKYDWTETRTDVYYDWGNYQTANGEYHSAHGQLVLRNLTSDGKPVYCLQAHKAAWNVATTAVPLRRTDAWLNLNKAAKDGEKLIYRIIDSEQLAALRQTNITFAAFEQGDKFSITLLPSDAASADEIIYSIRKETEFEYNRRINRELKAEAAKIGSSVRYKVIGRRELELISKSDIKFAFFEKNGKYNISFLASDEEKINNLIYGYGRKKIN